MGSKMLFEIGHKNVDILGGHVGIHGCAIDLEV